mmetsp:Transcript_34287/g.109498  ORF Transcript_34287/g.109498 Transcript_34287/m.109498 type:complete len:250 (+) Transcript_34287:304-1053(+)
MPTEQTRKSDVTTQNVSSDGGGGGAAAAAAVCCRSRSCAAAETRIWRTRRRTAGGVSGVRRSRSSPCRRHSTRGDTRSSTPVHSCHFAAARAQSSEQRSRRDTSRKVLKRVPVGARKTVGTPVNGSAAAGAGPSSSSHIGAGAAVGGRPSVGGVGADASSPRRTTKECTASRGNSTRSSLSRQPASGTPSTERIMSPMRSWPSSAAEPPAVSSRTTFWGETMSPSPPAPRLTETARSIYTRTHCSEGDS